MPKITKCLITVEYALGIEKTMGDNETHTFLCPACRKPVEPHATGGKQAAHFEHVKWNPRCPLRDKRWEKERRQGN